MRAAAIGIVEHIGIAAPEAAAIAPRTASLDHPRDAVAHAAEMDGYMRSIGDQRARCIEQRAREIEPLLDVDRCRGRLEDYAHFLGNRHEEVVENFQFDRIDFGARRTFAVDRFGTGQHEAAFLGQTASPAWLDHGGRCGIDDQGRTIDRHASSQGNAFHRRPDARGRARDGHRLGPGRAETARRSPGFDAERLDDDFRFVIGITEALAVQGTKGAIHRVPVPVLDREEAVAALESQSGATFDLDGFVRDMLVEQGIACLALEGVQFGGQSLVQPAHDAHFADDLHGCEADAIGGQYPRQRMDQHCLHTQRIGDAAGMLAARTAEAGERIGRHIVPARHADLADGVGHIVDSDGEETFGDFLRRSGIGQRGCNFLQPRPRSLPVERLVAAGAENAREESGIEAPEEQIAVGNR